MVFIAFAAFLVPLACLAQARKPSPPVSAPSALPPPRTPAESPKTYIPGLEHFMNLIQTEHAKLGYAGNARNWALAAYQLAEIKEIMSDVQDLVPTFKDLPLERMLDAVIIGPIAEVEKALDAKDFAGFSAGYDKLTQACNSCHQATANGFIIIRRPARPGFPNQDFKPK
jgi:hypothetical protein